MYKSNSNFNLKHTVPQSYFRLCCEALCGETKAVNKSIQCLCCKTHTSLHSPSRSQDGCREEGFSYWLFSNNSVAVNNMWKLGSPARRRAVVFQGERILPFRPFDVTRKPSQSVSEGSNVLGSLGLRTRSDSSISGWNTVIEANSNISWRFFFSTMKWDQNEVLFGAGGIMKKGNGFCINFRAD